MRLKDRKEPFYKKYRWLLDQFEPIRVDFEEHLKQLFIEVKEECFEIKREKPGAEEESPELQHIYFMFEAQTDEDAPQEITLVLKFEGEEKLIEMEISYDSDLEDEPFSDALDGRDKLKELINELFINSDFYFLLRFGIEQKYVLDENGLREGF